MNQTEQAVAEKVLGAGLAAGILALLPACWRRFRAWQARPSKTEMLTEAFNKLTKQMEQMCNVLSGLETSIRGVSDILTINESNTRLLLDNDTIARWETDTTGACVYANNALCRLFGMTHEQMLDQDGKGWLRAIIPDHRPRVWREFKESMTTGVPYSVHYAIAPDGTPKTMLAEGEPIHAADGRILRIRGTVRPMPSIAA